MINSKRAYDPIDYESIEKTEFWIMTREGERELDYDEPESMMEEEYPKDNGEQHVQGLFFKFILISF